MSLSPARIDLAGLDQSTREKVDRLVDVLSEVAKHPLLGEVLALKGGTAINLFWLDLPRLSIDIDFNCLMGAEEPATGGVRREIELAVSSVARAMGYTVQMGKDAHAGRKIFLNYVGEASRKTDNLKVDLNFLMRAKLVDLENRVARWPGASQPLPVLRMEEIYGSKVAALVQRTAARDLFDVYALRHSGVEMDGPLLHACAAFYLSLTKTFPENMGDRALERAGRHTDLGDLAGLVSADSLPGPREMAQAAVEVIEPMIDLTGFAASYYQAMSRGEYRPELIFGAWPTVLENARDHPAGRWKAKNIAEHREKQSSSNA